MDITSFVLVLILGCIIGVLLMRIIAIQSYRGVRERAVQGSRNSIIGEIYEKVLPALPNFPFAPKDMVFIGKGCDYIVFDGLSEGNLREVVFLELKSGKSVLNKNEKAIQYALEHHRVRYALYRIDSLQKDH